MPVEVLAKLQALPDYASSVMSNIVKLFHILGAILFLGNLIVSAVWKVLADLDGRIPVLRLATRAVLWTDAVFTLGGAVMLSVSGHLQAGTWGGVAAQGWILHAYAAFAGSGLLWLLVLLPLQWRQSRLLRGLPDDAPAPPAYRRLAHAWWAVGSLATLLPLGALTLMVLRPGT
jgi:uncharacterized membrane protein